MALRRLAQTKPEPKQTTALKIEGVTDDEAKMILTEAQFASSYPSTQQTWPEVG
jgi:hypothetical protein